MQLANHYDHGGLFTYHCRGVHMALRAGTENAKQTLGLVARSCELHQVIVGCVAMFAKAVDLIGTRALCSARDAVACYARLRYEVGPNVVARLWFFCMVNVMLLVLLYAIQ